MPKRDAEGKSEKHKFDWENRFTGSQWFTRGWTLQELLASRILVFISGDWEHRLGTKISLATLIMVATGIPEDHLRCFDPSVVGSPSSTFSNCSFAQAASWAAARRTTRPEDTAYSMLGILNVNMPLLYGEGSAKAFLRLQLEYLNRVDDETIFCWAIPPGVRRICGLLSPTVQLFRHSGTFRVFGWDFERPPFQMTNKGLRVEPWLRPPSDPEALSTEVVMLLNCIRQDGSPEHCVAIRVFVPGGPEGKSAIRNGYGAPFDRYELDQLRRDRNWVRRELYFPQDW